MTNEDLIAFTADHGRPPTLEEIMETFKGVHKLEEVKVGSGDKQTSLFYLREKADPKGDYFQATALTYDGIIWERDRAIRSLAQMVLTTNQPDSPPELAPSK